MARVPVSDLSQERVAPVAAPVNTFSRPAAGGQDLLRALSGLSPVLGKLADRKAQEEKEAEEALVDRKIGGMTFEEFKTEKAKDPALGFTSPWAKAALDRQWGARLGNEVRRQAEEELATADLTAVNAEEFVAQKVREAQAELPDSKHAVGGFTTATEGLVDKVRDRVNADRAKRTVEVRGDTVFANLLSDVERAVEDGVSPEAMRSTFRNNMQSNRDLLSMGYAEQDKLVMRLIQTVSQKPGMEAWVEMLGSLDRDNGVSVRSKMGPVYEAAQESAKAATLKADNEKAQPELQQWILGARTGDPVQFDEKEFNSWADKHPWMSGTQRASIIDQFRSAQEVQQRAALAALQDTAKETYLNSRTDIVDLVRTGHAAEISDLKGAAHGKEVEVSATEAKEWAYAQAVRQIEAEGLAQGRSPLTMREERIRLYGANGDIDPLLNARLSAFLNATANPGDIPQTVLDYLPELAVARRVAPLMVNRVATSDRDRLFIDTILTGMDYELSPQEAVKNAVYRRDNADRISLPSGKDRKAALDGVVKRIDGGPFNGIQITNRTSLDPIVSERLDYFAATGATGPDLQKRVADSIQRTHTYMNGHMIDVTGTGLTGPQALPIFTEAAAAVTEAKPGHGKLTFLPMGRGSDRFQAVTATGLVVGGTVRTWAEMRELYNQRRSARVAQRAERARSFKEHQIERWSSEDAGAGAPGSMIEPIR